VNLLALISHASTSRWRVAERRIRRIEARAFVRLVEALRLDADIAEFALDHLRRHGVDHALRYVADAGFGHDLDEWLDIAKRGRFGLRVARLVKRQIAMWQYREYLSENWGCLHSASAADCAAYSAHRESVGEWEARTGERWHD
jgi:hypothetical protein